MKKLVASGITLLSVLTLVACSGNQTAKPKASSEKSSSKVEKSSSKKSSSSKKKSSSSKKFELTDDTSSSSSQSTSGSGAQATTPEVVLVTDQEIENAKTIGDIKALYAKLAENYKKYANELGEKLPKSEQESYFKALEPGIKKMDEELASVNETLAQFGDDTTLFPEENRAAFIEAFKATRDTMTNAMVSGYKLVAGLTS
ncbi:hypothetical protein [Streptococcus australis]|uniref:hypothetical protein n=1 Tax=Streptococcus australis TaxID=113107 RepID=UPI0012B98A2C|nr:hypothetical protein [Streptococcus australis]MDB8643514.1 hypothetical protein [Streptococcus australis]MDB8646961.1 hypothetical protein [Streptococcus australis]